MKTIEVIYSPICESTGAMIGKLKHWLDGTDIQINIIPFHLRPPKMGNGREASENCFIDIYYCNKKIDSVPLHKDRIYTALGIKKDFEETDDELPLWEGLSKTQFINKINTGEIQFFPITKENYLKEMSMCLCNYPFGNPPKQYHEDCIALKSQVFTDVWKVEKIAGVFAQYDNRVIGLLEVMPREILQKYGFMTGTVGESKKYLSVGCYEVGYGIPRIEMIDELMRHLENMYRFFHRKEIEGIGVYEWNDGFNPYWVYEKYGFRKTEQLSENVVVMSKNITTLAAPINN